MAHGDYMKDGELPALETMVDEYGVDSVLEALSRICLEKSFHIQQSYGDKMLAASWRHDASAIDKIRFRTKHRA